MHHPIAQLILSMCRLTTIIVEAHLAGSPYGIWKIIVPSYGIWKKNIYMEKMSDLVIKLFPFSTFFYQKIKFLPKKYPFSGIWIGLKIFLPVADIIVYSFCYLNCLNSFICIF